MTFRNRHKSIEKRRMDRVKEPMIHESSINLGLSAKIADTMQGSSDGWIRDDDQRHK